MRTNIDLDEALVKEALELTQVSTKKELVHLALQELIRSRKKKSLLDLAGQIQLDEDFDLDQMRKNRHAAD
ncbi:type II toxin-antitoxin system VapB family antitoxin [Lyngbya confervoides]|uniref:Type II toxin-antitoxin system VapB family antitoxin n=1 Tax=Lyngbya confervoides BDU141951 TaxID=1574623 RepID=A0ABD4T7J0_9CYAN|nr:type II toxin-antitoxin system VapB family antitoxin [Lyngbya confervoides]MCM1984433.1 type II toxin-antitoxin system VapB family antitoxin [Lyngbya confervoides BDU141951]